MGGGRAGAGGGGAEKWRKSVTFYLNGPFKMRKQSFQGSYEEKDDTLKATHT